ncbi:hypothetical protein YC2023_040514 [Brassica napus]
MRYCIPGLAFWMRENSSRALTSTSSKAFLIVSTPKCADRKAPREESGNSP